jgi:O-methyltransferase
MMRVWLKRLLAPVIYRRPVPELPAERLYLYLDALKRTRDLPGAVVEVGCFQCGTSAWAAGMLRGIGVEREYICVDTFGGFVGDQFSDDVRAGTDVSHRLGFSANSRALVQRLLDQWHLPEIILLQADIVALPGERLPDRIAVALVDVDLEAPTLAALEKIFPALVQGGVILVDDCADDPTNPFRGARIGFQRFVAKQHLPERYVFGMGVIERT